MAYTPSLQYQVRHCSKRSDVTARTQHLAMVMNERAVALVSRVWSILLSRSLVLKSSSNWRGTRFSSSDIKFRYLVAFTLISSFCKKRNKTVFDSFLLLLVPLLRQVQTIVDKARLVMKQATLLVIFLWFVGFLRAQNVKGIRMQKNN